MPFSLPNRTKDKFHNPVYLQHLVNPSYNEQKERILIKEQGHPFQKLPWEESWRDKNIELQGWWQTEKYFKHHRDEILRLFQYPWEQLSGFVSVHVRRGDYLRLRRKHPHVTKGWIENAMKLFPGYHFIVFSDDIDWCKMVWRGRKDITFSEKRGIEGDLVYMHTCEHHICSASTFSWWGAWLNHNKNKKIIMPARWFTPEAEARHDTRDIVPMDWTRI
ncbi:MAG: putative O-antigen biosynthesis glycosyltransferase [Prokaryotic dsDNA virus sp.]|nr:MAG: putative O-antigen biosynthesis glycosyltransferase [Prokaryotic dsDNA virus sp.]